MGDTVVFKHLRQLCFGISPREASVTVRGFAPTTPERRAGLEAVGQAFIGGYQAALLDLDLDCVATACERTPAPLRGFSYEGAAMALALVDLVSGGRPKRFAGLIEGPGKGHTYIAHVGAGWAVARCPWGFLTFVPKLNPLLQDLVIDGVAFQAAYFNPRRFIHRRRTSFIRRLAPNAFDTGIGRAMWFASGASVAVLGRLLKQFDPPRHSDLWNGVGLAVAYTGIAADHELDSLAAAAGDHRRQLALGSAFAAAARTAGGNPTQQTDAACRGWCGCSSVAASRAVNGSLSEVSYPYDRHSYQEWRTHALAMLSRGLPGA